MFRYSVKDTNFWDSNRADNRAGDRVANVLDNEVGRANKLDMIIE